MGITIYNSQVKGSTADYYGDVQVYNNVQPASQLNSKCPLANTVRSSDYNKAIRVDDESDITALVQASLAGTQLITQTSSTRQWGVIRSENFAYTSNDNGTLYEINLSTHAVDQFSITNIRTSRMGVIDDHLLFYFIYSSPNFVLYTYNTSTQQSTQVASWAAEGSGAGYTWSIDANNLSVVSYGGEIYAVIPAQYVKDDGNYYYKGSEFLIYKYNADTQHDTFQWNTTDTNEYWYNLLTHEAGAVVINDKVIYSFVERLEDNDSYYPHLVTIVLDLDTLTHTRYRYTLSASVNYDPTLWQIMPDYENGVILITLTSGGGSNGNWTFSIDPSDGTYTQLVYDATSWFPTAVADKNKTYIVTIYGSDYKIYNSSGSLQFSKTTSTAGDWNLFQVYEGRILFWDDANDRIVGIRVTDEDTAYYPISGLATDASRIYLLGDKIFVWVSVSTSDKRLYIVEGS